VLQVAGDDNRYSDDESGDFVGNGLEEFETINNGANELDNEYSVSTPSLNNAC
jgi:hypothetical protein